MSPDGRYLAFVAGADARYRIWLRPLASQTAAPLAGTEGGTFPFWSPDSRFIAFFADDKLKKVPIGGGPATVLCEATFGRGGSWNRDNVILFSATAASAGVVDGLDVGGPCACSSAWHIAGRCHGDRSQIGRDEPPLAALSA